MVSAQPRGLAGSADREGKAGVDALSLDRKRPSMGLESGWGWCGELPGSHPYIKPSGKLTRQATCLVLVPKFGSSVV